MDRKPFAWGTQFFGEAAALHMHKEEGELHFAVMQKNYPDPSRRFVALYSEDVVAELEREILALREQLAARRYVPGKEVLIVTAANEKDAERYRWIKEGEPGRATTVRRLLQVLSGTYFDAAIDAEIAKAKG